MGLEKKEEDPVEHQVAKLVEAIQQLQQRITDLELQSVPNTPAGRAGSKRSNCSECS
jgi:hypothetical protein